MVAYIFPGGHAFPDDAAGLVVRFFKEHPKAGGDNAEEKGPAKRGADEERSG